MPEHSRPQAALRLSLVYTLTYEPPRSTAQGKIVRQESANIDANFERKKKQAEIEKKMSVLPRSPHSEISESARGSTWEDATARTRLTRLPTSLRSAISNQNNKARLQLLEKREELLEQVFDEAKSKIGEVAKDEKKYQALLKDLVLQVRAVLLRQSFARRGSIRGC